MSLKPRVNHHAPPPVPVAAHPLELDVHEEDFELIDDEIEEQSEQPLESRRAPIARGAWTVAVIDDDDDVHQATTFALGRRVVLGRPLHLLHAYNAAEGLTLLEQHPEVAVALVDVVMETPDAGLQLVRKLRERGSRSLRIILRTGQPGFAPVLEVLEKYDINDYRTKTELDQVRLLASLTTSLRAYDQLSTMQEFRSGLELVVEGMADLFSRDTLAVFSRGVLTQVAALLHVPANGLVCVSEHVGGALTRDLSQLEVISDAGRFGGLNGKALNEVDDTQAQAAYRALLNGGNDIYHSGYVALSCNSHKGRQLFIYMETQKEISPADTDLLRLFSSNIAIIFNNIQLMEGLDRLAYEEPVMRMPNSNALKRELETILTDGDQHWGLALAQVENAESLLSAYGAQRADEYLHALCQRLAGTAPGVRMIARPSEYMLGILFDEQSVNAQALHSSLTHSICVRDLPLNPNITLAWVDVPAPPIPTSAEDILQSARSGLIFARAQRRGQVYGYEPSVREGVTERIRMQSRLLTALATGKGLSVALQPKVDITRKTIVGAEALARWTVDGQPVSPGKFIPIVESSGLSRALRDRMVEEVGEWSRVRRDSGLPPLPVAINLSLCDIHDSDFATSLLQRIDIAGLDPDTLHFEITESGMMESLSCTVRELSALREAGYKVAVDDFGTGYSSLSYLEQLPIDTLKIDRCFISSLGIASARRSIAGTTIAMAQTLNLNIVAEGIETPEQHQALLFLGCPECQGFLYARPVMAADFDATYSTWSMDAALSKAGWYTCPGSA